MKIVAKNEPTYTIHDMPEEMLEAVYAFLSSVKVLASIGESGIELVDNFRLALGIAYYDIHKNYPA